MAAVRRRPKSRSGDQGPRHRPHGLLPRYVRAQRGSVGGAGALGARFRRGLRHCRRPVQGGGRQDRHTVQEHARRGDRLAARVGGGGIAPRGNRSRRAYHPARRRDALAYHLARRPSHQGGRGRPLRRASPRQDADDRYREHGGIGAARIARGFFRRGSRNIRRQLSSSPRPAPSAPSPTRATPS